ncbi:MAG: hypothetical protein RLY86_3156 [Pseudomonadota bacterium]
MSAKSWALVFVGILGVTGGLGGLKYMQISAAIAEAASMPEPMETVNAVIPRMGTWSAQARTVGTVASLRRVELRNELDGTVVEVGFESGAIVEQGQVLVQLDTSEEQADLAAAKAEAELARITVDRRQKLAATQAGSAAELDAARANLAGARARVAALEARIAKKTLTAPFRARVGIRDLQPGAYLSGGTLIATLEGADRDAYVDFSFPQDVIGRLSAGAVVTVSGQALADEPARARIVATSAAVDNSRSVRFRAVLEGRGDAVLPGSFVDIAAETSAPVQAMFVPLTAVRRAPYGDHVFLLGEQEGTLRARQQFVRLGPIDGSDVVVLSGLEPGQQLAANGSFKLRDGLAVAIAPDAPVSPAVPQTASR